jgi:hypothetical protein
MESYIVHMLPVSVQKLLDGSNFTTFLRLKHELKANTYRGGSISMALCGGQLHLEALGWEGHRSYGFHTVCMVIRWQWRGNERKIESGRERVKRERETSVIGREGDKF